MKSFKAFRLDTENHTLWRDGERVPMAPKPFDVLAYLIQNAGRVVTQDEMLEALWPETYVNPEVLRKYILEIRKALGDRVGAPEFIETLPKRGYRFVAPIVDENTSGPSNLRISELPVTDEQAETGGVAIATAEQKSTEEKRPKNKHRLLKLAAIPMLVAVMAVVMIWYIRSLQDRSDAPSLNNVSIAVLPFADMSAAKDQEYFSDGLAEQLINDLAKISGLRVVGRSSAFQFRGKDEDLREVGRKLGVANILEGSVRRDGNHVRITAELIKVEDGFQLWSQTYDRQINDIFAVQDEIALATTQALQLKLLGENGQPIPANLHSANLEAYQAYLQAQYFFGRGQGKEDLDKALANANKAIQLDEKYAPAWALRSSVQSVMARTGLTDLTDGARKARSDAERAIALDPDLASAYLALANIQLNSDWNWDAAETSLTKAATLEPGSAEIFRTRSLLSRIMGDLDQSIKFYKEAIALDPLRVNFYPAMAYVLYVAGQYDEAKAELQKALELNPQANYVHFTLAKILLEEDKPQQALTEIEKEPNEWQRLTGEALAYHALRHDKDSDTALNRLIARYNTNGPYQVAQVYAYRGEADKAFEWLERAYRERDSGLLEIKIDPLFKNLHRDPRFTDILKKLHLLKERSSRT
jgi:TolB-like protein/DNA-binding winged helix-turn-helix (wHTH) protein/Tfp pilus assembly protein PilF